MRTLLLAGLTALSLSAVWVKAGEPYPAASFEPEVIYRAEQQIPQAAEYPAANFTPQVIFQDPNLIETTGPAPESLSAGVQQLSETFPVEEPKTPPHSGAVSDVTPPYAALGLAVAVIALAFWQASRRQAKALESLNLTPAQNGGVSQEAQEIEEEEQDLEALALEVEQTLATTNRQRAGKTKRTRRR